MNLSLNKEQRRTTQEELEAHFKVSTLTVQDIAIKLDTTPDKVEKALQMKAPLGVFSNQLQSFIHLVWDVRDVINNNIEENGQTPEPYTYLKGEKEDYWFLR
ncbi:DUF2316 domain-containing protein [Staphylococcus argenteus]|nr:DUF2316 domain-containing protein [Staphylococcus argenteus]